MFISYSINHSYGQDIYLLTVYQRPYIDDALSTKPAMHSLSMLLGGVPGNPRC